MITIEEASKFMDTDVVTTVAVETDNSLCFRVNTIIQTVPVACD
jgi:hypothetical protein